MNWIDLEVEKQLQYALNKHGKEPWSRHEFYGILREEFEEVWEAIKLDQPVGLLNKEIYQVMAVCKRYLEIGDKNAKKKEK